MTRRHTRYEAGTGTQYTYEAVAEPYNDPTFDVDTVAEEVEASQYNYRGRTYQCGGIYWDSGMKEVLELVAVARKSTFADAGDSDGHLVLLFECPFGDGDQFTDSYEIPLASRDYDPNERFVPRHNLPYNGPQHP